MDVVTGIKMFAYVDDLHEIVRAAPIALNPEAFSLWLFLHCASANSCLEFIFLFQQWGVQYSP